VNAMSKLYLIILSIFITTLTLPAQARSMTFDEYGGLFQNPLLSISQSSKGVIGFSLLLAVLVAGGAAVTLYFRFRTIEAQKRQLQIQMDEKTQELRKALAELERSKETTEMANQARSEFLANMAQELRTHLNLILGYTQILSQESRLTKKQRKAIEIIHRNSEHLLMLISEILDLSEIEARTVKLEQTNFNLRRFLWNIVEIVRIHAEQQGLTFDTEFVAHFIQLIILLSTKKEHD
jgi:signal transduction histidine kinase